MSERNTKKNNNETEHTVISEQSVKPSPKPGRTLIVKFNKD